MTWLHTRSRLTAGCIRLAGSDLHSVAWSQFLLRFRRWVDPRASAHQGGDARTVASMRNAGALGLLHVPPRDQCIASLVLFLDEALKDNARCPRPRRVFSARMGNSLSVLLRT